MRLDEGSEDLRSVVGSLCSMILFLVVLMFSYLKYTVLRDKKDVDILSAINESFYDETYTLS